MANETAFARALEGVASGVSYGDVQAYIAKEFPHLSTVSREQVLEDAYFEALQQDVESEDIDESWAANEGPWETSITMAFHSKAVAEEWLSKAEDLGVGQYNGDLDSREEPHND